MEAMQGFDLGLLYYFGSLHRPWLHGMVKAVSHLGDTATTAGIAVAAAGIFVLLRKSRAAIVILLVAVVAQGVELAAKAVVQRPRPEVVWRLRSLPNNPS